MDKKSANLKQLIRKTSASSDYYLYEVEDVVKHFIAHVQEELKTNGTVKIDGIGVIKKVDLKIKNYAQSNSENKDQVYNAVKLYITIDEAMRRNLNLKEQ